MSNFIADLSRIVFKKNETVTSSSNLEFVKFRKSLLNALTKSRKNGTVIGIYSPALGEGMFVTGVEDIYNDNNEQIIVLRQYDLSGAILQRNILSLGEIRAICAFDMPYRNPVLH